MSDLDFSKTSAQYAESRLVLLDLIHAGLEQDPQICAAWLAGSYGRGEEDEFSDLDLWVVVEDSFAEELCVRQAETAGGSIPARIELFARFGQVLNIHENHHNAPSGGSFSAVLYRSPGVIVDWVLLPRSAAVRPLQTRLLFDRVGVALEAQADQTLAGADQADRWLERCAFFWMMAMVTAKYIRREKALPANQLLGMVAETLADIAILAEETLALEIGAVYATPAEQAGRLRVLCMEAVRLGGDDRARESVETVLNLEYD